LSRQDERVGTFTRWVKYGRAKLDDVLQRGNEELDRREAELEADAAERPWAHRDAAAPTVDDVRDRIAHDAGQPAPAPTPEEGFDLAEQQRKADDRLSKIRDELGLGDEEKPPDA
jgi:hypothetical protein